jgi:predicted PurR-regulated permease PerM
MSQRKPSPGSDTAQPVVMPSPLQADADAEMRQLQWAGLSPERQLTLWGLTLLALGLALYFLSPVLAPFVAGTALGYLLDPIADRLQRLGLSRLGAAGLLLVVFLLVVGTAAVHGLLTQLSERFTSDSINSWLQEFGLGGAAASFDAQKYINDLTSQGATLLGDFVKSLLWRGYALINVISLIVITPVVAFYMLLDWDHMVSIIDDLIPPRHRDDVRSLARDIDRALAGFVRGQSLVCLFLGVWYAVGLSAIGLNFGFLIGVTAGFLSFVPYVGSITAFVLSIIVAVVQGWPHINLPIEAVAIVTTGLIMDGYVLSPRLVGASVGLHPVWIMFALLAFGALFGFTGLIVAVPVAAALGAFMRFLAKRYRASALYQHPIPDRA